VKPGILDAVSEADIDVVRDQFAAVNERDFDRVMRLYADNVVLVVHNSFGLETGTFEGKEAVGEWFGQWFRTFGRDYRFEIDEARMVGDAVFLHAQHGGTGRLSGAQVSDETSYLYRVSEGKVVRVELFGSRDEALEAAGASG
jgi:ketosteroid isomerase-like protein